MNNRRQRNIYIGADFLIASVTWLLFNLLRYYETAYADYETLADFLLYFNVIEGQVLIPLFWLILYFFSGYYNKPFGKSRIGELFSTFATVVIGCVTIFFIIILDDLPPSFHIYYRFFFALLIMQFTLTYIARNLITWRSIRKIKSREWARHVLIVGAGREALNIRQFLEETGYHIVGFVGLPAAPKTPAIQPHDMMGTTDAIPEILQQHKVDEIVVAIKGMEVVPFLYQLYTYQRPVKVLADKHNFLSKAKVNAIAGIPLIDITENNFSDAEKNIKWFFDKLVAMSVLVLLSPLYLFISVKVKLGSPGPVFFRQKRIGYKGKPFMIYKFRTMFFDASQQGPLLTARDDKRVTSFGRFLRKYRLDEIPQFWNVLKGDMSLVGPRPEQRYYIDQIVQKAPYYYLLHNVRPGITSWGMVKYGYAETVDKMIERLYYDILYYENMSIVLDIKIMIYTVQIVFTGKGV